MLFDMLTYVLSMSSHLWFVSVFQLLYQLYAFGVVYMSYMFNQFYCCSSFASVS